MSAIKNDINQNISSPDHTSVKRLLYYIFQTNRWLVSITAAENENKISI